MKWMLGTILIMVVLGTVMPVGAHAAGSATCRCEVSHWIGTGCSESGPCPCACSCNWVGSCTCHCGGLSMDNPIGG